jgi:hypothetical protein
VASAIAIVGELGPTPVPCDSSFVSVHTDLHSKLLNDSRPSGFLDTSFWWLRIQGSAAPTPLAGEAELDRRETAVSCHSKSHYSISRVFNVSRKNICSIISMLSLGKALPESMSFSLRIPSRLASTVVNG